MANRNKSPETFQSLQRRNFAVEVLQSYEKLSWFSVQRCESLLQTRLHFQNVIAGLEEYEEPLTDWKQDYTPRLKPNNQKKSRKGKDRLEAASGKTKSKSGSMESSKDQAGEMAANATVEPSPEPIELD